MGEDGEDWNGRIGNDDFENFCHFFFFFFSEYPNDDVAPLMVHFQANGDGCLQINFSDWLKPTRTCFIDTKRLMLASFNLFACKANSKVKLQS